MKKLSYIAFLFAFVVSYSCQKECIRPNEKNNSSDSEYVIKSAKSFGSDSSFDSGTGDDNGITDPNSDPDLNRKKGGK
jgi:hypothetical protein